MARTKGKRDIENVDLTGDDAGDARVQKASRTAGRQPDVGLDEVINAAPSYQSSQSFRQEEDDAEAADLIQGSQDVDDSSYGTYMLYGMYPNRTSE